MCKAKILAKIHYHAKWRKCLPKINAGVLSLTLSKKHLSASLSLQDMCKVTRQGRFKGFLHKPPWYGWQWRIQKMILYVYISSSTYLITSYIYDRRKFRSLTSDNMDSWKSSAARKKINRCGKKEDQQARNVREVAKCCVFQWFVCRLGRKVTSLKRRVRRWLLSEDMKNCTPL